MVASFVRLLAIVLACWFVGLAVLTVAIEPTRDVVVLWPRAGIGAVIARAPVRVLDAPGGFVRVRGDERGFVRALYASGAWLVLPASEGGCLGRYRPEAAELARVRRAPSNDVR